MNRWFYVVSSLIVIYICKSSNYGSGGFSNMVLLRCVSGTDFLYTSHGWTLISAVLEGASGQKFPTLAEQLFRDLGLSNTYLDKPSPIIYNRARYYELKVVSLYVVMLIQKWWWKKENVTKHSSLEMAPLYLCFVTFSFFHHHFWISMTTYRETTFNS